MNKWFVEKLKEDLEYYSLENIIARYDCFMIGNTLHIYKPIPVNEFIKLREELRSKKRVDDIIVGGKCEIIRFI